MVEIASDNPSEVGYGDLSETETFLGRLIDPSTEVNEDILLAEGWKRSKGHPIHPYSVFHKWFDGEKWLEIVLHTVEHSMSIKLKILQLNKTNGLIDVRLYYDGPRLTYKLFVELEKIIVNDLANND